jgi:hypothetical protein
LDLFLPLLKVDLDGRLVSEAAMAETPDAQARSANCRLKRPFRCRPRPPNRRRRQRRFFIAVDDLLLTVAHDLGVWKTDDNIS